MHSYRYILTHLERFMENPNKMMALKALNLRLAHLCERVLHSYHKGTLNEKDATERLDTAFRRALPIITKNHPDLLNHYEPLTEQLLYFNLFKAYQEAALAHQQGLATEMQMRLQQIFLANLVNIPAVMQGQPTARLTPADLALAYQNLRLGYQQQRIPEEQAQAQLAVLLRMTKLEPSARRQLEQEWLQSPAARIEDDKLILSNPNQPGALRAIQLFVPNNYMGPPLLYNWYNYFGKAIDNREFLMEKLQSIAGTLISMHEKREEPTLRL
jgi:hypothetical protein